MSKSFSIVRWNDAHATLDQLDDNDIKRGHRPHIIETYGYIVQSDEVGVSIAGEWLPPADGDEYEAYRAVTFVPRGMVVTEGPIQGRKPRKAKLAPLP
jgi:hypothetical protein